MRARALLLLAGLALGTPGAARAGDDEGASAAGPAAVGDEDRSAIAACLREAAGGPRACIGSVAVGCARRDAGAGAAAGDEVGCSRREAAIWRERLDLAGTALGARLDSGPRSRLAASQRSWESYAVQTCAFAAELQAPARAAAAQAACALREVAVRAIEVERMARRASAPPAPARPLIER